MPIYVQYSPVPTHVGLHNALRDNGFQLHYFRFFFFPLKPGIILIHFPDEVVDTPSLSKMLIKLCAFIFSIAAGKLLGSKIVWEINNLKSHERRYPAAETAIMWVLVRAVDGIIHSSSVGAHAAFDLYPALRRAQSVIIPESNFLHVYKASGNSDRGRKILGVDDRDTVLLSFGLVRRYKGADRLIEVFKQIEDTTLRLVIVGLPVDRPYADELQSAAQSDTRVRLLFRSVSEEEVPDIYAAATLACAPFRAVLNSASVLLSLSCNCPVVAARLGTMSDLEEHVSPRWLHLYDGEINSIVLRNAIDWARNSRAQPPRLEFCDFEKVVTDTVQFLTQLTRKKAGHKYENRQMF